MCGGWIYGAWSPAQQALPGNLEQSVTPWPQEREGPLRRACRSIHNSDMVVQLSLLGIFGYTVSCLEVSGGAPPREA